MYQYTVERLDSSSSFDHEELINRYARNGWELVQVVKNYCYDFYFYFRRKK